MHANTDHDEEYNRLHWRPILCSPELESRIAPKHGPVRDVSRGSFTRTERFAPLGRPHLRIVK